MADKRIFSGMQPSGEAHLGNYLGALRQWVRLQDEADCIYCIVDYHAITGSAEPESLPQRVFELAIAFLAVGLDPARCTMFVQSDVPAHTELMWLLNTVTPIGELERMTQYKDKTAGMESIPAGLLNYPVLQAADILIYHATGVPVGEDQLQHLELTREIARRFNHRYGYHFPEPQPILSDVGRIRGLDGSAKMSKSQGNTVGILDPPEEIQAKVRQAVTDPLRVRRTDPGRPEVCNVCQMQRHFMSAERAAELNEGCRTAAIGCVDSKRALADAIARHFEPMRARAAEYRARPERVWEILGDGAARCRELAQQTLTDVRERVGLNARQVFAPTAGS